jgi:autotransporter-associated beta strand protein
VVNGGTLALGGKTDIAAGGTWTVNNATIQNTINSTQTILGRLTLNGGTLSSTVATPDSTYGDFYLRNTGGVEVYITGDTTSVIGANFNMAGGHNFVVGNGAAAIDLDVTGRLSNKDGYTWGMMNKYGDGTMRVRAGGNNTAGTHIRGGEVIFGSGGLGQGVSGQAYKAGFYGNSTLTWDVGNTEDITVGSSAGAFVEDGVTATLNTGANNVTLSGVFEVGSSQTGAITKKGGGTLTIGGANSYKGNTTILEGTLATSGTS